MRAALLEIGAPAAADQQAIAGEGRALVIQNEGQASVGMARGCTDFNITLAELDRVAVLEQPVSASGAACFGKRNATAATQPEKPGAGHMIGVHVRLQCP